ncbi:hypothetical protein [Schleiferilactobacillus shenzhenensis]|uniref:Uncharacterized protein n=1 Tax=Schleiferilactobacillus shenzhenensis LY-73 TaxID=1231336 RepID=U4TIT2_9LACO|nr:hypothetical protein [Schleiferilactobacillus shenzhenensis]ERL64109.1 hypothetical protein L248_1642 [Schleiferilactobacillus shenzhenensis LY-73]
MADGEKGTADLAAATRTPAFRQALRAAVLAGLPAGVQLVAANYARTSASSYWLLRWPNAAPEPTWLTLRIATHQHWLTHVQQVEIVWPQLPKLTGLSAVVTAALTEPTAAAVRYQFTPLELAILKQMLVLADRDLVWLLQLTPAIAASHKGRSFDLQNDLRRLPLLLGDRNNVNNFLTPVSAPGFQDRIIDFFGANLLFAQFSAHHLLKLLPTIQWVKPILAADPRRVNWQVLLASTYGQHFMAVTAQAAARHRS